MIVFRTARTQLGCLTTLMGFFAVKSVTRGLSEDSRVRAGLNFLSGVFYASYAFRFGSRGLRDAGLVVGREGLQDFVGLPPAGFLPWDKIASVEILAFPLGAVVRKYLGVRLASADPREGGRRRSRFEPEQFTTYAILIPEYALEDRVEEVHEMIQIYLEEPSERDHLESLAVAPGKPLW